MDNRTAEQKRKNMQAVKSKGTEIENILARELSQNRMYFRRNVNSVFGKPDFAIKKYKIAIFCDSEFWHGYNWSVNKNQIKSNKPFWHKKIKRNICRDNEVNTNLICHGWYVMRFWGNEIKKNPHKCIIKVINVIQKRKYEKNKSN